VSDCHDESGEPLLASVVGDTWVSPSVGDDGVADETAPTCELPIHVSAKRVRLTKGGGQR
jgi:hypothetical protein